MGHFGMAQQWRSSLPNPQVTLEQASKMDGSASIPGCGEQATPDKLTAQGVESYDAAERRLSTYMPYSCQSLLAHEDIAAEMNAPELKESKQPKLVMAAFLRASGMRRPLA